MDNPAEDPNNIGGLPPQADIPPNLGAEGADGEDVDRFYDDGGETFLPADHVSDCYYIQINC